MISSFSYTYDVSGYRLSETDSDGTIVQYFYDGDHRVIEERVTDPTLGNSDTHYTYDAVGNRLTMTNASGTTVYTYDADDRLLTAGNRSYPTTPMEIC